MKKVVTMFLSLTMLLSVMMTPLNVSAAIPTVIDDGERVTFQSSGNLWNHYPISFLSVMRNSEFYVASNNLTWTDYDGIRPATNNSASLTLRAREGTVITSVSIKAYGAGYVNLPIVDFFASYDGVGATIGSTYTFQRIDYDDEVHRMYRWIQDAPGLLAICDKPHYHNRGEILPTKRQRER